MKYVLTDAAVRKLRGVLAPRSGNTGAGGAATPVSPDDFPPPFTVRWAQSQSEGQGAWVIWLPSSGSLVNYDGAWLTFSGTSAASGLPAGWVRAQGVSASATAVYLLVVTPPGQTSKRAMFTSSSSASGVTVHFSVLVATMSVDSTTGARRVKQTVDSSVIIGAEDGGDVNLDDVSTDYNGSTEVQIKDWDAGTPVASSTIAADLKASGANAGHVVFRESDGTLSYKSIGSLNLPTSTINLTNQTVLTGLSWNSSSHKLEISSVKMTVTDGLITGWTPQVAEEIQTTDISSIIGS